MSLGIDPNSGLPASHRVNKNGFDALRSALQRRGQTSLGSMAGDARLGGPSDAYSQKASSQLNLQQIQQVQQLLQALIDFIKNGGQMPQNPQGGGQASAGGQPAGAARSNGIQGGPQTQGIQQAQNGTKHASTAGTEGAGDPAKFKNLSAEQKKNAKTIIDVGKKMGASQRDIQIALMTAMQESQLKNLNYGDRDSLGLFQQRPSQGWGSKAQVTNPEYAASKFYEGLMKVKNRDALSMTAASHKVQRSAHPNAPAKYAGLAKSIVNAFA